MAPRKCPVPRFLLPFRYQILQSNFANNISEPDGNLFQLVIVGCVGTAVLLCLIVFFCWKRNRRLEYKYSRLARQSSAGRTVHSSSSNTLTSATSASGASKESIECDEADLVAAESCALDDDEEDEEENGARDGRISSVTVPIIKTGKSYGIVNKIRSMAASKVLYIPSIFIDSLL